MILLVFLLQHPQHTTKFCPPCQIWTTNDGAVLAKPGSPYLHFHQASGDIYAAGICGSAAKNHIESAN